MSGREATKRNCWLNSAPCRPRAIIQVSQITCDRNCTSLFIIPAFASFLSSVSFKITLPNARWPQRRREKLGVHDSKLTRPNGYPFQDEIDNDPP